MEFPHLNDTLFPILGNVDVYKYKNIFNYARWEGKVSFKLLNVRWNSNYADVPYFETVEKRDEWFDSQNGYAGILETLFNSTPDGKIKIPIPYNDAYRYNYLVVDMPVQTSADEKLNYEDTNIRISRWFYFIEDMVQLSPSTTEMQISVDYWTTFINIVDIPYLMLERGHAPMTKTTVETYLANPLANNEYLLATDFNYGNDTVIQTSNYKPIGNGEKWVVFCAPYSRELFTEFETGSYSGSVSPASYGDTSARYGYQYRVDDYDCTFNNVDYSNSNLPIRNQIQSGILDGCECFAVLGTQARAFFNLAAQRCVNFLRGIQAVFILDGSLFSRSQEFTFLGYTLYRADQTTNVLNFSFTKDMFNFDAKYRDIAKLYTSPYSMLEVTDDEGNSFSAKIENCGDIKMHTLVSLVYPYLNYNVFFEGINGNGKLNYQWMNIQGSTANMEIWQSDFSKYMMNWDIPTYSIFASSEAEFAADNNINMQIQRNRNVMEYRNAVRFANTGYENTKDSLAANTANIQASTQTNKSNIERTEAGILANTVNANDTNEYIVYDLQFGTGGSMEWNGGSGGFYTRSMHAGLKKLSESDRADRGFIQACTNLGIDYIAATAANNSSAAINGGWISGLSQIGGSLASPSVGSGNANIGGSIISGASTIAQGYVSADVINQNSIALITKDTTVASANQSYMTDKFTVSLNSAYGTLEIKEDYSKDLIDTQNQLAYDNTARFSDTLANEGINNTNANATKTTTDSNAVRTQLVETANADYTRNANIAAEKNVLNQKQSEMQGMYETGRLKRPTQYGSYKGDFAQDAYKRRGVRVNIRTQNKSAIAQAGDAMLRFGYALHRVWDMADGFHYGKEFTFWKAEDVWINDGSGVANIATNAIGDILMKGVTIWRDPNKIGLVGIYNNL